MKKRVVVCLLMLSLIFIHTFAFADDIDEVMFFNARTPEHGEELWRSDGTEAGTVMVKDIQPGRNSSNAYVVGKAGRNIFLIADDGVHGKELWRSDGTLEGTEMVKDAFSGSMGGWFSGFTPFKGLMFYIAQDYAFKNSALWRSDGTLEGTYPVKENIEYVYKMNRFNNAVYLLANENTLIKSDGTKEGTVIVKTFKGKGVSRPYQYKNHLFFSANDGIHGPEIWKTDGTSEGCMMVKDLVPGKLGGADWMQAVTFRGKLYFTAYDSDKRTHLWQSDGTEDGTIMVKNVTVGHETEEWVKDMTVFNGKIYFSVYEYLTDIVALWKSDGTPDGTVRIADFDTCAEHFFRFNSQLYFYANYQGELWRTDGTKQGTVKVLDLWKPQQAGKRDLGGQSYRHAILNGEIYLGLSDTETGYELWVSNGTKEGSSILKDIVPGKNSSYPYMFFTSEMD